MTMHLIGRGAESVTATGIFILLTIDFIGSCIRPQRRLGPFFSQCVPTLLLLNLGNQCALVPFVNFQLPLPIQVVCLLFRHLPGR